jgi:ferric-dicitrate binding protein FerR (iron transport regulator)
MDYKHIKLLLNKYLEGTTSLDEENKLKKFFTGNKTIPDDLQFAVSMFTAFKHETTIKPSSNKNKPKIQWLYLAASIVILLGLATYIFSHTNKPLSMVEINDTNTPKKIILSKGTIIWLNSGAEISYAISKKSAFNMISLKGEAYFEFNALKKQNYQLLAHNAIIKVESKSSFNVKMTEYDPNINITVSSGAIKVLESNTDKSLTLLVTQGNYCSVHKTEHLVFASKNDNPNFLAWKTGELNFDNQNMASVTDILAQYYQVEFEFKDLAVASCQFSGTFRNNTLDYVLKQLQANIQCKFASENGVFTISGKPCS